MEFHSYAMNETQEPNETTFPIHAARRYLIYIGRVRVVPPPLHPHTTSQTAIITYNGSPPYHKRISPIMQGGPPLTSQEKAEPNFFTFAPKTLGGQELPLKENLSRTTRTEYWILDGYLQQEGWARIFSQQTWHATHTAHKKWMMKHVRHVWDCWCWGLVVTLPPPTQSPWRRAADSRDSSSSPSWLKIVWTVTVWGIRMNRHTQTSGKRETYTRTVEMIVNGDAWSWRSAPQLLGTEKERNQGCGIHFGTPITTTPCCSGAAHTRVNVLERACSFSSPHEGLSLAEGPLYPCQESVACVLRSCHV